MALWINRYNVHFSWFVCDVFTMFNVGPSSEVVGSTVNFTTCLPSRALDAIERTRYTAIPMYCYCHCCCCCCSCCCSFFSSFSFSYSSFLVLLLLLRNSMKIWLTDSYAGVYRITHKVPFVGLPSYTGISVESFWGYASSFPILTGLYNYRIIVRTIALSDIFYTYVSIYLD